MPGTTVRLKSPPSMAGGRGTTIAERAGGLLVVFGFGTGPSWAVACEAIAKSTKRAALAARQQRLILMTNSLSWNGPAISRFLGALSLKLIQIPLAVVNFTIAPAPRVQARMGFLHPSAGFACLKAHCRAPRHIDKPS